MLYSIVHYTATPTGRRIAAFLALMFLPVVVIFALLFGTASHIYLFAKGWFSDLYEFITRDLPGTVKDFARVVRTGKKI